MCAMCVFKLVCVRVREWVCSPCRAHQSCFNRRGQTLDKEYSDMTKCNQNIHSVLSCSAFQTPCWSTSVNVSHRHYWNVSLWMDVFNIFYYGLIEWITSIKEKQHLPTSQLLLRLWSGAGGEKTTWVSVKVKTLYRVPVCRWCRAGRRWASCQNILVSCWLDTNVLEPEKPVDVWEK